MNISNSTRQAYSEVYSFLLLLDEKDRNKVPLKLRNFFKEEKDKEYVKVIKKDIPIKDQNLKEETLALIAFLNLKYWCDDEDEKQKLMKIYADNDKKYNEALQVNAVSDVKFKNNKNIDKQEDIENNNKMIKYEKNGFFTKLKRLLKRLIK